MSEAIIKAYVTKADSDMVRVKVLDDSIVSQLLHLGFSFNFEYSEYTQIAPDNKAKAKIFKNLRDINVSFSGGKEWCPAEVFEYLRDQTLVEGPFLKVTWQGPKSYKTSLA